MLDNTYFLFSSDNGFHISQHRLHPGKECGYEDDIRVPFVIRGPGIPSGVVQSGVSSHSDLAPTILSLANLPLRSTFDGRALDVFNATGEAKHEHVGVEFWGIGTPEDKYNNADLMLNNTYKSLRLESKAYSLYYSVWCTNEVEFYDMKQDPGQLRNKAREKGSYLGRPIPHVVHRLDALLMVLKSCKGDSCRQPWRTIHPFGNVYSLIDALDKKYDTFYKHQPKVAFSSCELGYFLGAEGPQDVHVYSRNNKSALSFQIDPNWSWSV